MTKSIQYIVRKSRTAHLEPPEDDIHLLIRQRLHVAGDVAERRDQQALDDTQDLLPHPPHDHLLRGVAQVRIQRLQIRIEVVKQWQNRLLDLDVCQLLRPDARLFR